MTKLCDFSHTTCQRLKPATISIRLLLKRIPLRISTKGGGQNIYFRVLSYPYRTYATKGIISRTEVEALVMSFCWTCFRTKSPASLCCWPDDFRGPMKSVYNRNYSSKDFYKLPNIIEGRIEAVPRTPSFWRACSMPHWLIWDRHFVQERTETSIQINSSFRIYLNLLQLRGDAKYWTVQKQVTDTFKKQKQNEILLVNNARAFQLVNATKTMVKK